LQKSEEIAPKIMEQIKQAIKRSEIVEKPVTRLVHFSGELGEIFKELNDKTDMTKASGEARDTIKALADVGKKLMVELKNGIGSSDNPLIEEALKRIIDFLAKKTLEAMDWLP
jgi:peptidoglycan/xylan/chitin deacetylase (PgdA/CDA1 family)